MLKLVISYRCIGIIHSNKLNHPKLDVKMLNLVVNDRRIGIIHSNKSNPPKLDVKMLNLVVNYTLIEIFIQTISIIQNLILRY